MSGEHVDDALGVARVAVHAHAQGLDAAQHQPRVHRAGNGADRVLVEGDLLGDAVVGEDHRSPDDVGVTAHVLRRRVHDDVGAERDRLRQIGRGERVVDDQQRAGLMGELGDRRDVDDAEQRVGRRLDPHDLRDAGADRGGERVDVVTRGRGEVEPPRCLDLVEQPVGAAVRITRDDGVVAGHAQGAQDGVLRGQPGRERQPAPPALDRGQALLERGARGVGAAAVLVATAQPAHAVLLVGRRLEDRGYDGAGGRIGLLTGVDGERLEVHGHERRCCAGRWHDAARPSDAETWSPPCPESARWSRRWTRPRRPPGDCPATSPEPAGGRPTPDRSQRQHEAFVALLAGLGVEVVVAEAPEGMVDALLRL